MDYNITSPNQTLKIDICCFSAKHAVLRRKSGLVLNQDNVSEWGDMSICGLVSVSELAL